MEPCEFNAPQFLDLQHIRFDDGADKIFDNATTSVTTPSSSRPSSAMDVSGSLSEENENENQTFVVNDHPKEETEDSSEVEEVLQRCMNNLLTISKNSRNTPKEKNSLEPSSHVRLKQQRKRQGSPIVDQQPKKYISLAESVYFYHLRTPQRFRPESHTSRHSQREQVPKKVWHKHVTIPQLPHLTSHRRTRPVQYLGREEEEKRLADEIKAYKIKARPLNKQILAPPKLGVRVEQKPCTVQVPFNLTDIQKKKVAASLPPLYVFTARPVPKNLLRSTSGLPEKQEKPLTNPVSPVCLKRSKVYANSLVMKDGEKCFVEEEVHHFGIPTVGGKRHTETQPFSFEERDKEMRKKKEERIQKVLEEEKKAREFHAKPIPTSVTKSPALSTKSLQLSTAATMPVPFHFEIDKRMQVRQEQFKQKLEEEARAFQQMLQFKAQPATVIQKKPFEPKKTDRPLTDITAVELNTEKRAKEREEFDLKVRLENEKLEELRKQRDEERKRLEEEEISRLRKEMIHKANPVRHYKKFEIHKH